MFLILIMGECFFCSFVILFILVKGFVIDVLVGLVLGLLLFWSVNLFVFCYWRRC